MNREEKAQLVFDYLYSNLNKYKKNTDIRTHLIIMLDGEDIREQELRDLIKVIRENYSGFAINKAYDSFLVADNKGYKLTTNKQEIKVYMNSMIGRLYSLKKQIEECNKKT